MLHFFDVGPSLLETVHFSELVQPIDDLDGQFTVRWISDRFFLHSGINIHRILLGTPTMEVNTHLEDLFKAFFTNTVSKLHQLRAMARRFLLKLFKTTKGLVVGVTLPL